MVEVKGRGEGGMVLQRGRVQWHLEGVDTGIRHSFGFGSNRVMRFKDTFADNSVFTFRGSTSRDEQGTRCEDKSRLVDCRCHETNGGEQVDSSGYWPFTLTLAQASTTLGGIRAYLLEACEFESITTIPMHKYCMCLKLRNIGIGSLSHLIPSSL